MAAFSLLLTDDQPMFREGLALLLKQQYPDLTLFQASNGNEAIRCIKENPIDIVLLDVNMPEMNGIETARVILKDFPKTRIIILTQYNGEAMIATLMNDGVHGFLLKNSSPSEIMNAIDTVHVQNKTYITPNIGPFLKQMGMEKRTPSVFFTKREAEILMYLKMGKSSRDIAERTGLKENTVNSYREDMLQKTKTRNVAELIAYAFENGVFG